MRSRFALLLILLAPAFAPAQTADVVAAIDARIATLRFVAALYDADAGAFKPTLDGKPSLRASSAALRAVKYLGADKIGAQIPPSKDALTAFALKCYDPETGGFADTPGGQADATTTAVGVMAAVELGIPEAKFPKAIGFLKANAKGFEDARLAVAALEAVKAKPDWVVDWMKLADAELASLSGDGAARTAGGAAAMKLRLGFDLPDRDAAVKAILTGQRPDGAWGKAGAKGSDLETTYRVMRALVLLKEKPADAAKVRGFIAHCRNADGGYGVIPGGPSNVGATYYAAIVTHWLDGMK